MRLLTVALATALGLSALGQTDSASVASKPVTRGQFFVALGKFKAATDRQLGLPSRSGSKPSRPETSITRKDVILALSETFDQYRPHFSSHPRPAWTDKAAITARNPKDIQPKLEHLVRWGFVAPVGPLVVGPLDTMTAAQAGDALGFFWNQLTFLTHPVDPRWSPRLEPQGGG